MLVFYSGYFRSAAFSACHLHYLSVMHVFFFRLLSIGCFLCGSSSFSLRDACLFFWLLSIGGLLCVSSSFSLQDACFLFWLLSIGGLLCVSYSSSFCDACVFL